MGDSQQAPDEDAVDDHAIDVAAHLADVDSGAGCTEIWEHLSERREDADHGSDRVARHEE